MRFGLSHLDYVWNSEYFTTGTTNFRVFYHWNYLCPFSRRLPNIWSEGGILLVYLTFSWKSSFKTNHITLLTIKSSTFIVRALELTIWFRIPDIFWLSIWVVNVFLSWAWSIYEYITFVYNLVSHILISIFIFNSG